MLTYIYAVVIIIIIDVVNAIFITIFLQLLLLFVAFVIIWYIVACRVTKIWWGQRSKFVGKG